MSLAGGGLGFLGVQFISPFFIGYQIIVHFFMSVLHVLKCSIVVPSLEMSLEHSQHFLSLLFENYTCAHGTLCPRTSRQSCVQPVASSLNRHLDILATVV